jgi:DNA invertase Pin-like site-specific DNA recombinase
MTTLAYSYRDPLLEPSSPPESEWGRPVDRIYHDQGDRHQWTQLLQDWDRDPQADPSGENYLLIRRLDELGETVEAVGDRLDQLQERGIVAIALQENLPLAGLTTGEGVTRADLLQLLQTLQTRYRQQRLRRGHARNRLQALPPPGRAPYGYRRGQDRYLLDRSTAPVVKDFFDHFLLYGSLRRSVRYLEKRYGKKISVSTGQRWLTSPVYRGDLAYKDGQVLPDTHGAILSRDEAAQIDRLLRRNRRLPRRTASAPRSLAGLVTCANCQSPLRISRVTSRRGQSEYLYLRPVACGRSLPEGAPCRAIPYDQILNRTIERICEDLPQAVAELTLPDVDQVKQAIAQQVQERRKVLDQLPQLVETGVLDAQTADLRAYTLQGEIAALTKQSDQLPPGNLGAIARAVSLPQFWLDLSEAERRFYFREFIRQVQLHRKNTRELWQLQLVFIF